MKENSISENVIIVLYLVLSLVVLIPYGGELIESVFKPQCIADETYGCFEIYVILSLVFFLVIPLIYGYIRSQRKSG